MIEQAIQVPFVDLSAQHQELLTEIEAVIRRAIETSGFIGGPQLQAFEDHFADYCGVEHAVGVSDGTRALILALQAVGVMPGDLVLTVSHTFIATAEAIVQCGAAPVFLEVDPTRYTLSPSALTDWVETHCQLDDDGTCRHVASGRRLSAVVPVHLYGLPVDMEPILKIARKYNLKVVEDACQAHGAWYTFSDGRRRRTGSLGDAGCFSFYPGKNLGAMGEGGAVVTNDARIAAQVRMLRDHGQSRKYIHETRYGINARLDAIQAGVLDIKLRYLDEWNENRRCIATYYREQLSDMTNIQLPCEPDYGYHVYHLFVILVDGRERVQCKLQARNIATGLHYPVPVHLQKAFAGCGYSCDDLPVTEQVADKVLSLPMFPHMTERQAEAVVEALRSIVTG